jgi:hypothetical protein
LPVGANPKQLFQNTIFFMDVQTQRSARQPVKTTVQSLRSSCKSKPPLERPELADGKAAASAQGDVRLP